MRVEISHKFTMGFVGIVFVTVLLNLFIIPRIGIEDFWIQQYVSVAGALLAGLIIGVFFSRVFTRNIKILREASERISHGDLSQTIRLQDSVATDETAHCGSI